MIRKRRLKRGSSEKVCWKRELKASYTIEAALLTPFFVGIVILIMYMGMYLYDMSSLQEMANHSIQKAAACQKLNKEEISGIAKQCFQKNNNRSLFFVKNVHTELSVSGNEIGIMVSGNMDLPVFYITKRLVGKKDWEIKLRAKAAITEPVDFIRKVRMLEHAGRIQKKFK